MERIRIPNAASYFPLSLSDLFVLAPLASRVLFRATLPGRILSAFTIGAYAGSAALDWLHRREVRRIDFRSVFGVDPTRVRPMSAADRRAEVRRLVEVVNAEYTPMAVPRRELAEEVDRHLTTYIAEITGQWVETSAQVRDFMLAQLFFPFALGACDPLTGDVAIFRPLGVFEPHVIAHEFAHRKGYWKELHAQLLAYLALSMSGDPVLLQSARCERLYRQFVVLSRETAGRRDPAAHAAEEEPPHGTGEEPGMTGAGGAPDERPSYERRVRESGLRPELEGAFLARAPGDSLYDRALGEPMRRVYDLRMRATGQGGLTDYDEGMTNVLHALGL